MKVKISNYVSRKICNLHNKYMNDKYGFIDRPDSFQDDPIDYYVEILDDAIQWFYDHTINLYLDRKKRYEKVVIHKYDTWSMDATLALIILPMLKQLHEQKQSSPIVDEEDVPAEITDVHERWDYVIQEMIFAFDMKNNDDYPYNVDDAKEQERICERVLNGFKLFGKYYEGLWS